MSQASADKHSGRQRRVDQEAGSLSAVRGEGRCVTDIEDQDEQIRPEPDGVQDGERSRHRGSPPIPGIDKGDEKPVVSKCVIQSAASKNKVTQSAVDGLDNVTQATVTEICGWSKFPRSASDPLHVSSEQHIAVPAVRLYVLEGLVGGSNDRIHRSSQRRVFTGDISVDINAERPAERDNIRCGKRGNEIPESSGGSSAGSGSSEAGETLVPSGAQLAFELPLQRAHPDAIHLKARRDTPNRLEHVYPARHDPGDDQADDSRLPDELKVTDGVFDNQRPVMVLEQALHSGEPSGESEQPVLGASGW